MVLCGLLLLTFLWGMLDLKYGDHEKAVALQRDSQAASKTDSEIRVLLKNDGYASEYHEDICLTCDKDYRIQGKDSQIRYKAGEKIQITPQSDWFAKGEVLQVSSDGGMFYFPELERAEENIGYKGSLEIRKNDQGLLLVNVLSLENYLCGVLPSEMSDSFPMEALKAQAICARTYALQQQENQRAKEFGADLDDSTSYQVYNNRQHGTKTDQAVKETAGLVMMQDGALADARYYSTSCGLDLHRDLSEESVFAAFLQEDQVRSVEAEEPFYRWKTSIQLANLQVKTEWKTIESLQVTERNEKGAVTCLEVTGSKATEKIEGEYQIRQFLALADPVITLQDGSTREGWQLLPSAFFYLQPVSEEGILTGYEVYGGGYGHGEGMSQNGAQAMAKNGKTYEQILQFFFTGIEIQSLSIE